MAQTAFECSSFWIKPSSVGSTATSMLDEAKNSFKPDHLLEDGFVFTNSGARGAWRRLWFGAVQLDGIWAFTYTPAVIRRWYVKRMPLLRNIWLTTAKVCIGCGGVTRS